MVCKRKKAWQDIDTVLKHFGQRKCPTQTRYLKFLEKGIGKGRNPYKWLALEN